MVLACFVHRPTVFSKLLAPWVVFPFCARSFRFQARRRIESRLHAAGATGHLPLRPTEPAAGSFGEVAVLQLAGGSVRRVWKIRSDSFSIVRRPTSA